MDDFCELNGGLQIYSKGDDDTPATEVPEDPEDPEHPYNETSKRWVSACDSIPRSYVNVRYNPAEPGSALLPCALPRRLRAPMSARLRSGTSTCRSPRRSKSVSTARGDDYQKYEGVKGARSRLGDARRYGQNLVYRPFPRRVHLRHEHRRGEEDHLRRGRAKGTALDYTPSSGGMIQAFYYTIPNLKFGQWAELITTSTNAYGSSGKSGSSSSSTSGSSGYSSSYLRLSPTTSIFANSYYGSGGSTGVLRRLLRQLLRRLLRQLYYAATATTVPARVPP